MSWRFAKATARSKKLEVGDGAGGVVRVVEPQHLRAGGDVRGDGVEVGQEAVLLEQRHACSVSPPANIVPISYTGYAGIGHERDVAGVDEAEGDVADALLRADERTSLPSAGRASRRSGARTSARRPGGTRAGPRSPDSGGWPARAAACSSASRMCGGVGRSGSPMPNEMTSMPSAFFAATFLLIWAKRYGGSSRCGRRTSWQHPGNQFW